MERFVPARLHGVLDYATVGLFVAGADIFRVNDAPGSIAPAKAFGLTLCFTMPLTDYGREKPFGGMRLISMKQHLAMDTVFALAVGLSPWITGTWRKGWNYWVPQAFAMSSELFFAMTTKLDEGE